MIWWPSYPENTYLNVIMVEMGQGGSREHFNEEIPTYEELLRRCNDLQAKNEQLQNEINNLKNIHFEKIEGTKMTLKRPKIKRRTENELVKNLPCHFPNCKKEYASSIALNLHIRLKHNPSSNSSPEETPKENIFNTQNCKHSKELKSHIKKETPSKDENNSSDVSKYPERAKIQDKNIKFDSASL